MSLKNINAWVKVGLAIASVLSMPCCSSTLAVGQETEQKASDEKAAAADDKKEPTVELTLAEGRLELAVPKAWEKKKPRFGILEAEFAPVETLKDGEEKAKEDLKAARLTVMASGGSVEQNIERWMGQFSQEDDSTTNDHTDSKKVKVNGMQVHIVSITGTYDDRPGPFAPSGVQRPGYKMLAAIVETKVAGNYYFKMYGPKKAVDDNEKRFMAMLKTLKIVL